MNARFATSIVSAAAMCCCVAIAIGQSPAGKRKAPSKRVSFATVQPIFQAKCVSCHNDARHPGDVNLSSYLKLLESGPKGGLLVAGQPDKSKLLLYVDGTKQPRMPFRQAPLSKKEIAAIRVWIAAGARS